MDHDNQNGSATPANQNSVDDLLMAAAGSGILKEKVMVPPKEDTTLLDLTTPTVVAQSTFASQYARRLSTSYSTSPIRTSNTAQLNIVPTGGTPPQINQDPTRTDQETKEINNILQNMSDLNPKIITLIQEGKKEEAEELKIQKEEMCIILETKYNYKISQSQDPLQNSTPQLDLRPPRKKFFSETRRSESESLKKSEAGKRTIGQDNDSPNSKTKDLPSPSSPPTVDDKKNNSSSSLNHSQDAIV